MTDKEKKDRLLRLFNGEIAPDDIEICGGDGVLKGVTPDGKPYKKKILKLSENGKILSHYTPDPWKDIYKVDNSIESYEEHLRSSIKEGCSNQDIKHKQKLKAVEWVKKKRLQDRVEVMADGSLIFESKYIEKPENLSLLKSSFFVLTLRDCLGKLPNEGFNRWRVLIESILKKL